MAATELWAALPATPSAVEARRRHTVVELWDTETRFLQHLTLAQTLFLVPLRHAAAAAAAAAPPPLLPNATVEAIFGNIDDIIALSKEVRRRGKRGEPAREIGARCRPRDLCAPNARVARAQRSLLAPARVAPVGFGEAPTGADVRRVRHVCV